MPMLNTWYTSHYLLFYDWLKLWQHLLEISTTFLFIENHASSFNGDDFYNFLPEISSPPSTPLHAGWPPWRTCRSPSLAVLRSGSSVFSNLVALWRPHSDRGTSCPCFPGSFYTSWPCLWGRSLVLMLLWNGEGHVLTRTGRGWSSTTRARVLSEEGVLHHHLNASC